MKKTISAIMAAIVVISIGDVVLTTQAPKDTDASLFSGASILSSENKNRAKDPQTTSNEVTTLLQLLEQAIDKDHDLEKGKQVLAQQLPTEVNKQLLKLYEGKIAARNLDFQTAEQLLAGQKGETLSLLRTIVLIAEDKRDEAGSELHQLILESAQESTRITARNLLDIYQQYDKQRDADPSYLWTLFAQKLGELREYEISHYLAQKATNKQPEYRDAWIIKGYDEMMLKKMNDAELSLLKAYGLDPVDGHTQYLLGLVYAELMKPDLSNKYLLYAKESEKKYEPTILMKLAENSIMLSDYPLAAYYYESLIAIEPNNSAAMARLVWLYAEHLQQFDKAQETLQALSKLNDKSIDTASLRDWVNQQKNHK